MTNNSRGRQAGELLLNAERVRNQAAAEKQSLLVPIDLRKADELEARVREAVPDVYKESTIGGELVPVDDGRGYKNLRLRNTVDDPDYIAADACRDRLSS